jgi:hypothetical protein
VEELDLLLESCRSPETRQQYAFCLEKYFKFVGELPRDTNLIEVETSI